MCTIRASELSAAGGGDLDLDGAAAVDAPAWTSSPGPASTGTDSPVMAERSRLVRPARMTPSVAARSPGRSTSHVAEDEFVRGDADFATVAEDGDPVGGTSESRARRPRRVRVTA